MLNIVLFEPEIPENTGNIMRTCAATGARLHLIRPLGFRLDATSIKRSGVNYIDKVEYILYDDYEDFCSKNDGEYYFMTRYGKKAHSEFDYTDKSNNIYLIFGKESTGIRRDFPGDSDSIPVCSAGDPGSILGLGRSPWRREWQPTPVFLPVESQG